MAEQRVTPLPGCTPEPLMGYLKALGVLRLVGEQRDAGARAFWKDDVFHLSSLLDADGLTQFFIEEYSPTPVVSPWGGGSGFFAKDNKEAVNALRRSQTPRLARYRVTIETAVAALGSAAREKPDKKEKELLRRRFRGLLPEESLAWLDAAFMETEERQLFAPLLGTGGNDGRLDFSQNYMQRVCDILLAKDQSQNEARLCLALFGSGECHLVASAIGQFDPGGVGGPNAVPGFEADSLVNPWDFVLMIEGTLLLTGSTARRLGGVGRTGASFPFTVSPSAAGWGTLATGEPRGARAEIWVPLWQRPSSLSEVAYLHSEGRAQVGSRPARDGVDFARAVAGLGVDRGVAAFQRYGLLQRSGLNYLAAPLGRMPVRGQEAVHLLDEVDPWLGRLRRAASSEKVPTRYQRALRRVEEAIFAYCQYGGRRHLQSVLATLGAAERELAVGQGLKDQVPPLYHLSPRWLRACDDGSPELRIAAALASISGGPGPIRAQLEPVVVEGSRCQWSASRLGVVWGGGDLVRNLAAILGRRQVEARRGSRQGEGAEGRGASIPNPELRGRVAATLGDVDCFLAGRVDDGRLADLLWALSTLRWHRYSIEDAPEPGPRAAPALPRAYALLKLLYLTTPLRSPEGEAVGVRPEPSVLPCLRAGDLEGAVRLAHRRLRASGLAPRGGFGTEGRRPPDFVCSPLVQSRLAAALLIPVWQTDTLADLVLKPQGQAATAAR